MTRLRETQKFEPWTEDGLYLTTSSLRFMGLVKTLNSCVVVEVPESGGRPGYLLIWNPIKLSPAAKQSLRDIESRTGLAVEQILNPFDWHHFSLLEWQADYPAAEVFVVSERPIDLNPRLKATVLDAHAPVIPGTEATLKLFAVQGCVQPAQLNRKWWNGPRRELFVYHQPSATLLVGDMFHCGPTSRANKLIYKMHEGFGFNRLGFRVRDKAQVRSFLDEVLSHRIDRMLTVHGTALAEDPERIPAGLMGAIEGAVGPLRQ